MENIFTKVVIESLTAFAVDFFTSPSSADPYIFRFSAGATFYEYSNT